MQKNYFISIYLDTRRPNKKGKFPVKLRVYTNVPRRQKLYPTKYEFTLEEFKSIWETKKPRLEHKDMRIELQAIEIAANKTAEGLTKFTFLDFERMLMQKKPSNVSNLQFYYNESIQNFKKNKQFSTASNYELSLKSFMLFHGKDNLDFYDITVQWLKDFQYFMVDINNRSRTTVGIYLRTLRTIFNIAISDKSINSDIYPFGKRKYQIPEPKSVKKALSKNDLKILFNSTPETPEQEKAKDFFFFSYSCNGMNFKDIVYLKYKDISSDILTFDRKKTENTNKSQRKVTVYLNEFSLSVIEKYGNKPKNENNYIFSIIDYNDNEINQYNQRKNFIRFVNQHIKKLAKANGIDENISTYWARHSFATMLLRIGGTSEYISEALSHSNIKITQNYLAGFPDDTKKEFAKKIMEF